MKRFIKESMKREGKTSSVSIGNMREIKKNDAEILVEPTGEANVRIVEFEHYLQETVKRLYGVDVVVSLNIYSMKQYAAAQAAMKDIQAKAKSKKAKC